MCERKEEEAARRRKEAAGYRTKNKNPTERWGKSMLGGLGIRKTHYFWQMDFIHFAKGFLGTPCNAYISAYFSSSTLQPFYGPRVHD